MHTLKVGIYRKGKSKVYCICIIQVLKRKNVKVKKVHNTNITSIMLITEEHIGQRH